MNSEPMYTLMIDDLPDLIMNKAFFTMYLLAMFAHMFDLTSWDNFIEHDIFHVPMCSI